MRQLTLGSLAVAVTLAAGPLHGQTIVETYTGWDGTSGWHPFGLLTNGATDAYGQSFQAPAQYLNNWTLWMRGDRGSDASGLLFTANVGTWDGNSVGSILWTSALFAGTSSATYQQYTFNTGGVSLLTGGQTYIFFLDAVSGPGQMEVAGGNAGEYAAGSFNYHNGTDHFSAWDGGGLQDLAFRAEFDRLPGDPGSTVPEPATMTLLATGLAGIAAGRRRKKQ